MRISFLLITAALAIASPARAQGPTQAVFSSALRVRLRRQILVLVPQLRSTGGDGSSLALPAAQVGDFDLALRLARNSSHRDRLWHWRALQLANVGKQSAALKVARNIQYVPARADVLLVAARYAVDRGRVELAQGALSEFSNFKSGPVGVFGEVEDGPRVDQVVYGGYLWARANQPDAARRLWKRAWPLLLAKAQEEQKWKSGPSPLRGEPAPGAHARIHLDAARSLVSFMGHAGMMGDLLPYLETDGFVDFHSFAFVLISAQTPEHLKILRDWLIAHDGPRSRESWMVLAAIETQFGEVEKAHEDYAHALALPLGGDTGSLEADVAFSIILGELWNDDTLRSNGEARLRTSLEKSRTGQNAETVIWPYRIFQYWGLESKVRANVPREELLEATDKLVASGADTRTLDPIASEWRARGDDSQVLRVARAMVATGRVVTQRYNERRPDDPASFWDGGAELQGANWLRVVGKKEEAQAVAEQFARNTLSRFRPFAAMRLWKAGFADTANTLFDPVAELRKQRELKTGGQKNASSQFEDWGRLAATQARFASPDAPTRWFEHLPTPQLKAQTLAAWIEALSPSFADKYPFVRYGVSGGITAVS